MLYLSSKIYLDRSKEMNFKTDLSNSNQELLIQLGVKIEDRNYTVEEIKKCENNIATHIMSKSLKNMDLAKESVKYSNLMNILTRYDN